VFGEGSFLWAHVVKCEVISEKDVGEQETAGFAASTKRYE
jgi:hypothetical protein